MMNTRLTPERLSELERDALSVIKHKGRYAPYMLINSNELISMIAEIRELRLLAHPDSLTAAYMAGAADTKNSETEPK